MYELPVAAPRRHKKQPSSSIIDIASRTFMARPGRPYDREHLAASSVTGDPN
jgi:hypothetical protein